MLHFGLTCGDLAASRASSYPAHPIRAIWKWQSKTPRNSGFIVYAHFAFIPGKGDNDFVSLSN